MFYLSLDSTFMGVKNKIEFFFLLKTSTQNKKCWESKESKKTSKSLSLKLFIRWSRVDPRPLLAAVIFLQYVALLDKLRLLFICQLTWPNSDHFKLLLLYLSNFNYLSRDLVSEGLVTYVLPVRSNTIVNISHYIMFNVDILGMGHHCISSDIPRVDRHLRIKEVI